MMVTPVAKAPIAFRKSAELIVISAETLLAMSLWCGREVRKRHSKVSAYARANRLHYHAEPLYHSIQVTVRTTADATPQSSSAPGCTLDGVQPGVPISREWALRLITCPDADLPRLLAAARAA